MAVSTPRTRNLKLYLSSGLTVEARVNLELIDKLGETFASDNTNSLFIRQKQDIHLLPGDPSVGGSAGQGNLFFGSATSPINNLKIFTTNFEVTGSFTLKDLSSPTKLTLSYNSSLVAPLADTVNRVLSLDVQAADRQLTLGGNLKVQNDLDVQGPAVAGTLVVPYAGTVVLSTGAQTLSGKTLNASANTIIGLTQTAFAPATNLPLSIIGGGSVSLSEFSSLVGVTSPLQVQLAGKQPVGPYITSLTGAVIATGPGAAATTLAPNSVGSGNIQAGSILDSNLAAGISRSKLAVGSSSHVLINDVGGNVSSTALLPATLGGTGVNGALVTYPGSGIILTNTNNTTVSNKVMDGSVNYFTNIGYSSLSIANGIINTDVNTNAGIVYSKLNLAGGIVNADISASATISGLKVSPSFGSQQIRTSAALEFSSTGVFGTVSTTLSPATNGQIGPLTFLLPNTIGPAGYFLSTSGSGQLTWTNPGFGGTVTSVGLVAPAQFSVTNSPITTMGNLNLAWVAVPQKTVLAGPATGVNAAPSFRALQAGDLPSHQHISTDVSDFVEAVQDVLGATVQSSSSISWAYNDTLNTLSAAVSLVSFTTSALSEGSNLYFTAERAQDAVFPAVLASPDLTLTYNDAGDTATIVANTGLIVAKPYVALALNDVLLFSDTSNAGALSQASFADVQTLIGGGSSAGVAANWTNLNGTTRTVTHSLGTRDVFVQIYDSVTYEEVRVDNIIRSDTMTVILQASEAPSTSWRVLIKPL